METLGVIQGLVIEIMPPQEMITQKNLIPVQAVAAAGRSTAEVAAVADSVAVVFVVVDNIQQRPAWPRDPDMESQFNN